jgi:hypothetical protein
VGIKIDLFASTSKMQTYLSDKMHLKRVLQTNKQMFGANKKKGLFQIIFVHFVNMSSIIFFIPF